MLSSLQYLSEDERNRKMKYNVCDSVARHSVRHLRNPTSNLRDSQNRPGVACQMFARSRYKSRLHAALTRDNARRARTLVAKCRREFILRLSAKQRVATKKNATLTKVKDKAHSVTPQWI